MRRLAFAGMTVLLTSRLASQGIELTPFKSDIAAINESLISMDNRLDSMSAAIDGLGLTSIRSNMDSMKRLMDPTLKDQCKGLYKDLDKAYDAIRDAGMKETLLKTDWIQLKDDYAEIKNSLAATGDRIESIADKSRALLDTVSQRIERMTQLLEKIDDKKKKEFLSGFIVAYCRDMFLNQRNESIDSLIRNLNERLGLTGADSFRKVDFQGLAEWSDLRKVENKVKASLEDNWQAIAYTVLNGYVKNYTGELKALGIDSSFTNKILQNNAIDWNELEKTLPDLVEKAVTKAIDKELSAFEKDLFELLRNVYDHKITMDEAVQLANQKVIEKLEKEIAGADYAKKVAERFSIPKVEVLELNMGVPDSVYFEREGGRCRFVILDGRILMKNERTRYTGIKGFEVNIKDFEMRFTNQLSFEGIADKETKKFDIKLNPFKFKHYYFVEDVESSFRHKIRPYFTIDEIVQNNPNDFLLYLDRDVIRRIETEWLEECPWDSHYRMYHFILQNEAIPARIITEHPFLWRLLTSNGGALDSSLIRGRNLLFARIKSAGETAHGLRGYNQFVEKVRHLFRGEEFYLSKPKEDLGQLSRYYGYRLDTHLAKDLRGKSYSEVSALISQQRCPITEYFYYSLAEDSGLYIINLFAPKVIEGSYETSRLLNGSYTVSKSSSPRLQAYGPSSALYATIEASKNMGNKPDLYATSTTTMANLRINFEFTQHCKKFDNEESVKWFRFVKAGYSVNYRGNADRLAIDSSASNEEVKNSLVDIFSDNSENIGYLSVPLLSVRLEKGLGRFGNKYAIFDQGGVFDLLVGSVRIFQDKFTLDSVNGKANRAVKTAWGYRLAVMDYQDYGQFNYRFNIGFDVRGRTFRVNENNEVEQKDRMPRWIFANLSIGNLYNVSWTVGYRYQFRKWRPLDSVGDSGFWYLSLSYRVNPLDAYEVIKRVIVGGN